MQYAWAYFTIRISPNDYTDSITVSMPGISRLVRTSVQADANYKYLTYRMDEPEPDTTYTLTFTTSNGLTRTINVKTPVYPPPI